MPDSTAGKPCHTTPESPPCANNTRELPVCHYWWIGSLSYEEARQLQENLAQQIASGNAPPTLLLLEHPHTYTIGRRGTEQNLLWDAATCAERGISVHWIDRGGDITYHGPGQLVGYPLLPLGEIIAPSRPHEPPKAEYITYLRQLEEMLIQALESLGVLGFQVPGKTGVWVRNNDRGEKLASIGVKVDAQGITRHGFALNVSPDMSYWQGIVPCGLINERMTSLAALLSSPPSIQQVCEAVIRAFCERFHYHMVKYP